MKLLKSILMLISLVASFTTMAFSGKPVEAALEADSWLVNAVKQQNQVDRNAPFSTNNTLGTHNAYNSHEYANDGYVRYLDPNQKHTIGEQLYLGSRSIELDILWAINAKDYRYHIVLCHKYCSPTDRFLHEGLGEVREWLDSSASDNQVLHIGFEDHVGDAQHAQLYKEINDKIGPYVYKSNGCKNVSAKFTKADVLASGKKVIITKGGDDKTKNCSDDENLKNMVFTGMESITRVYEDHTFFGSTFKGTQADINSAGLIEYFKNGGNRADLDSFTYNDGRTEASIWSWDRNEPNNYNGSQDCAVQWGNGRWDDANCDDSYGFACNEVGTNNWQVTGYGAWSDGLSACAVLGNGYQFAVPTNSKDNEALRVAKGSSTHAWLNYNDQGQEGQWVSPSFQYRELRDNRANLCMDIDGGVMSNGRQVRLWSCNGSRAQKWKYEQSTGLIRAVKNPNFCLDVADGSFYDGSDVQLWSCKAGHANQTWDLLGNTVRPRANHGLAIDAFGASKGANIGLWSTHGGNNQSWTWGHQ